MILHYFKQKHGDAWTYITDILLMVLYNGLMLVQSLCAPDLGNVHTVLHE